MNISTWISLGTILGRIEPAKWSFYRNMVRNQDLVILMETRHISKEHEDDLRDPSKKDKPDSGASIPGWTKGVLQ